MDESSADSDYVRQLKPADFDVVMHRLMGNQKQRTDRYVETWSIVKAARPKEEILIHAAFESCAFKSAMSCVAGKLLGIR